MFKAVIQEAAALASLSLFVGMIAIWTQVLGKLWGPARRHSEVCAKAHLGASKDDGERLIRIKVSGGQSRAASALWRW